MKANTLQIRNKIIITTLVCLLTFTVIFGVSKAQVYGSSLIPFGIGIVFALLFSGVNGYLLAGVYFASYNLAGLNVVCILEALNVSVILSVLYYLKKSKNLKLSKWLMFVAGIFSQVAFIIGHLGSANDNLALLIMIILSLLFLYSCLIFVDAISSKLGFAYVGIDEKICGAVILILFMYGMSATHISIINLGLVFASLLILISTYLLPANLNIIMSAILGVAYSLQMQSAVSISIFVVMALLSIGFKSSFKYLSAIAINLIYVGFVLVFNIGLSYGEMLSVLIGSVIFCFVPLSVIDKTKKIFDNKYNITVRNVLSSTKKQIIKRVQELSLVFGEMDKVYRDMVRGILPDDKAKVMLKEELLSSLCSKCKNYDACFRVAGNFMENSIDTIINIAYERGRVLLIDLPQHLSSNCISINELINIINGMVDSYKNYTTSISNLDTSRLLIANQLGGVSKLLDTLSREVDININFDNKFDERIREELGFKNIVCYDVAVYEKDIQTKNVNLIIKTDTIENKTIEKIVSKIINVKLKVSEVALSDYPNASVVRLVPKPNYDIAYGCSTITKTGKVYSGDSKALVKIDDGKYMVTICDGMGSGEGAYNISSLTISLIEKFYMAGFDNDTILNSVNKLLSITEEEKFSTIDLCIIDGKKNIYDFIKLGATSGYLKRDKGECEIIDSSGLPVGVLEEIRPHITRKIISPFDMLVFVSDGVTDSFEGKMELSEYIRNSDIINPLTLSKTILNEALKINGGIANDDMTVICVRVFED